MWNTCPVSREIMRIEYVHKDHRDICTCNRINLNKENADNNIKISSCFMV